jgi:iron(III) transport system ATP-binding protein
MSNRVPLARRDAGWAFEGHAVTGELRLPGNPATVTARVRPEDLLLAPTAEGCPNGSLCIAARVVDSQFGGRHMDVIVTVGETRLHARVASGAFGGWARKLELDQDVVVGFDPSSAVYYGDDDTRIAGHVDLTSPVSVGA